VFYAICGYPRLNPGDGSVGSSGTSGPSGNSGQFGSGAPSCDPSDLSFSIYNDGTGVITLNYPGSTFEGTIMQDYGFPVLIIEK
jgi:hypothetical protein